MSFLAGISLSNTEDWPLLGVILHIRFLSLLLCKFHCYLSIDDRQQPSLWQDPVIPMKPIEHIRYVFELLKSKTSSEVKRILQSMRRLLESSVPFSHYSYRALYLVCKILVPLCILTAYVALWLRSKEPYWSMHNYSRCIRLEALLEGIAILYM